MYGPRSFADRTRQFARTDALVRAWGTGDYDSVFGSHGQAARTALCNLAQLLKRVGIVADLACAIVDYQDQVAVDLSNRALAHQVDLYRCLRTGGISAQAIRSWSQHRRGRQFDVSRFRIRTDHRGFVRAAGSECSPLADLARTHEEPDFGDATRFYDDLARLHDAVRDRNEYEQRKSLFVDRFEHRLTGRPRARRTSGREKGRSR